MFRPVVKRSGDWWVWVTRCDGETVFGKHKSFCGAIMDGNEAGRRGYEKRQQLSEILASARSFA